jgi:hypothetical protein
LKKKQNKVAIEQLNLVAHSNYTLIAKEKAKETFFN